MQEREVARVGMDPSIRDVPWIPPFVPTLRKPWRLPWPVRAHPSAMGRIQVPKKVTRPGATVRALVASHPIPSHPTSTHPSTSIHPSIPSDPRVAGEAVGTAAGLQVHLPSYPTPGQAWLKRGRYLKCSCVCSILPWSIQRGERQKAWETNHLSTGKPSGNSSRIPYIPTSCMRILRAMYKVHPLSGTPIRLA